MQYSNIHNLFTSAYYYLWYYTPQGNRSQIPGEGKWTEGYLRSQLVPPQYPTLGEYVMNDPEVIETHIDWAANHGINCFICNWEGMRGHQKFLSENLVHILQGSKEEGTLSAGKIPYSTHDATGHGWDAVSMGWHTNGYAIRNLERMKFSGLIESRSLLETWPPHLGDKQISKAFGDAIIYFAENFFGSPQWQRIEGKPVVYLYEVWSWQGSSKEFEEFRAYIDTLITQLDDPLTNKKYSGVYIVADALYAYQQDIERLSVFDAITGYQPYPPYTTGQIQSPPAGMKFFGPELFTCPWFEEYHHKFFEWGKKHNISLIPTAIPRYNDRGVRGAVDHYAYPPASKPPFTDVEDVLEGKLFIENIKNQLRWCDPSIPMLNINSWNEWFEDTAIEPVGYFPGGSLPDYFNQGDNVGSSTHLGNTFKIPDKIVVYGENGHEWIDTPEYIKEKGIDITQGFEWPCYGFSYLKALKKFLNDIRLKKL